MSQPPVPYTTVRRLIEIGFETEHGLNDDCETCEHPWADHVLHATFGDPLDGGISTCPSCECTGTWSAGAPNDKTRDSSTGIRRTYRPPT